MVGHFSWAWYVYSIHYTYVSALNVLCYTQSKLYANENLIFVKCSFRWIKLHYTTFICTNYFTTFWKFNVAEIHIFYNNSFHSEFIIYCCSRGPFLMPYLCIHKQTSQIAMLVVCNQRCALFSGQKNKFVPFWLVLHREYAAHILRTIMTDKIMCVLRDW